MARKLNIPQRQEAKIMVADLYAEGRSTRYIAERVTQVTGISISHVTAGVLVNEVIKDVKARYEDKIDELFWMDIERYNRMEAKMWDAWDLSCQQRAKRTSRRKGEPINNPQNNTVRSVKAKEVSDSEEFTDGRGDPRYATIIMDCIDKRLQWLGKLKFGVQVETAANVINNTDNSVTLVINTPLSPKMQALREAVKTINVEVQENNS